MHKEKKAKPRDEHQIKKARKGHKSMRNKPEYYDENKTRATVSITPTAIELLDRKAKQLMLSRSELVERFARDTLFPQETPEKND